MTMTDPIADMLTRCATPTPRCTTRCHAGLEAEGGPGRVLVKEGYIVGFSVDDNATGPGQKLKIDMKYSPERRRVISGIRRVSKPGLRVYRKHNEVERVLGGLGVAVLSTSKGS
jgi:small subunit ribosomal protein S8